VRRWILACVFCFAAVGATACGPQYPNCEQDDNCHSGEYCVLQHCQECRHANDCASSQRCVQGRCE